MARDPIRLPSAMQVSGPASMRPSGANPAPDMSGLFEGLNALDRGGQALSRGLQVAKQREDNQRNVSEVAAAEASWLKDSLDIGNAFSQDGDWKTYSDRAEKQTQDAKDRAAALITDPVVRNKWLGETELRRLSTVDTIMDRGRALEQQERVVGLGESLKTTSELITDPDMSDAVRNKARADIKATIDMAESSGLIEPVQAAKLRETYVEGAEHSLAVNRAELDLRFRPEYVRGNVGISSGMTGTDVSTAVTNLTAGKPVAIDPMLAGEIAPLIGDRTLPADPKLREAYLSDPEVNQKYVEGAINYYSDRYKGDISAVVVATVPGGSAELADKWVKSGHDMGVLPASVKKSYQTVINSMTPEAEITHLPIIAAPGVNLEAVDVNVLTRFENVQSIFGTQLPITSGARDKAHNDAVGGAKGSMHLVNQAIDVDVSSLSRDEVVRLIETASAQGFTGIGVYNGSIHLDTGARRAWGPSYHAESVPAWAKEAIDKHLAGEITVQPAPTRGVAKEYQALTFDDRLALYDRSKVAVDQQRIDMKAGLELDVANAPAAIANTGSYDRDLPSAEDFVAAYGAVDGIERFKAFDGAVEVAEKSYGMRTMSNQDIEALVQASIPTGSGDMAEVEDKKFQLISTAAKQVLDEREKDPAAYAMKVFPAVQDAWANAGDDPQKFSQAVAMMGLAQEQLGIANPQLIPTDVAKQAADTFNNIDLPADQRLGALTHLPLATNDQGQQEAIYDQLVAAGVPPMTRGAMAALSRGDTAAAQYLFKAALVDPDKLGLKLPENVKPADITQRITEKLYDSGQIGDVVYGLSDGTADNFQRAGIDNALIERAVKMRLYDGSATSLDQAIDMTAKDMFGDVQVVTGKSYGGSANLKLVLPKDENPQPYVDGFTALRSVVGDAILADMTPVMVGALQSRRPPAGPAGQQAGMVEPGNIDLNTRPKVRQPDGSFATVRSMSFEEDGREVLVPTVGDDGKMLSDEEAIAQYEKTGRHLGKFDSAADADAYAEKLHQAQEAHYGYDPAETAIMRQARDQRVSDILETGYFASAGNDAFVFVDAHTGQAVPDPYGDGPLTFTRDDVMTASVGQAAKRQAADQSAPNDFGWSLAGQ